MATATLREWLEDAQVDWSTLILIAHTMAPGSYSPGWGTALDAVRFDFTAPNQLDVIPHPLLDHKFDCGYGAPEAPMFIARDKSKTYFPYQYDGATGLVTVFNDIEQYMDVKNGTPYPGG